MKELQKMQKAPLESTPIDAGATDAADDVIMDDLTMAPPSDAVDEVFAFDPVMEKATQLSLPDLLRIRDVADTATLAKDLATEVMPGRKIVFVVDCPTSRSKVLTDLVPPGC